MTIKIKLPKRLDGMSESEKKKFSKALDQFAEAKQRGDEATQAKILRKFNLTITTDIINNQQRKTS